MTAGPFRSAPAVKTCAGHSPSRVMMVVCSYGMIMLLRPGRHSSRRDVTVRRQTEETLTDIPQMGSVGARKAPPRPTFGRPERLPAGGYQVGRTNPGLAQGKDRGAARAEGRTVRRNRQEGPKQPGSGPGPRSGSPFRPRSAGGHARKLTEDRPRSRVSGVDRAHVG